MRNMTNEEVIEKISTLERVIEDLIHLIRSHCEIDTAGSDLLLELINELE